MVVVVLHDLALACRWADKAAVLANGTVAAFGSPVEAITAETLRLAYGVEARVEEGPGGRLRIEVEDALPAMVCWLSVKTSELPRFWPWTTPPTVRAS